ncbi:hypothetical protein HaLaN_00922 [Haematococcus lacustris]|uniref:Uncharacterized protein n=1 Tax=Haematococcus lacustris TaxID=44745 RepID=A0A699YT89_HAELA|nr:hypothetical protein HaLaN_00922 [Haematococcus lacustris]
MLEVSRRQHFVTNKQRGLLWQLRSLQRLHPAASLAFKVPAAGSHLAVPRMGQAVSQSADELISGRKPTPATRQAQPSISNPTHLIVLANGLHGTPANSQWHGDYFEQPAPCCLPLRIHGHRDHHPGAAQPTPG